MLILMLILFLWPIGIICSYFLIRRSMRRNFVFYVNSDRVMNITMSLFFPFGVVAVLISEIIDYVERSDWWQRKAKW